PSGGSRIPPPGLGIPGDTTTPAALANPTSTSGAPGQGQVVAPPTPVGGGQKIEPPSPPTLMGGKDIAPPNPPAQTSNAPPDSPPTKTAPPPMPEPEDQLGRLCRLTADRYAGIEAYTCRLRRREVVANKNKPLEEMLVKFRKRPFSIYFKWIGKEGK